MIIARHLLILNTNECHIRDIFSTSEGCFFFSFKHSDDANHNITGEAWSKDDV
jgi:hypothetical protein